MKRCTLFVIIASINCVTPLFGLAHGQQADGPLPRAHAHNDYLHDRPLLDALDNGFCSVEADIFLVEGKLMVAHSVLGIRDSRTLEALYLNPLRERVKRNNGRIYKQGPRFTLLIDIKNKGADTYRVLHQLLSKYDDVFSHYDEGRFRERAVTAIISGDRANDVIAKSQPRFAGIDGRISDLDTKLPAQLMPLISDNWRNHFKWRGDGTMPVDEFRKLRSVVQQAHEKDRRIRFWASPDKPAVWKALHDAGADLINTDDLPGLSKFLREQSVEE